MLRLPLRQKRYSAGRAASGHAGGMDAGKRERGGYPAGRCGQKPLDSGCPASAGNCGHAAYGQTVRKRDRAADGMGEAWRSRPAYRRKAEWRGSSGSKTFCFPCYSGRHGHCAGAKALGVSAVEGHARPQRQKRKQVPQPYRPLCSQQTGTEPYRAQPAGGKARPDSPRVFRRDWPAAHAAGSGSVRQR